MAVKWTNPNDLDKEIRQFEARYNTRAVQWLMRLGEQVVSYAREHGSYTDQTSNLRNSIGYLIVQHGRVIHFSFEGDTPSRSKQGDVGEAHKTGYSYARDVASNLDKDKTYLVWVAGMEYAAAVEAKGYDVLKGSGDWVESEAKKQMEYFKRYLLRKL